MSEATLASLIIAFCAGWWMGAVVMPWLNRRNR